MSFFERLITAGSGLSSKRFLSLYAALLFGVIVVAAIVRDSVTETLIWAVVTVILGGAGATLLQNKKGGENNTPPSEIG